MKLKAIILLLATCLMYGCANYSAHIPPSETNAFIADGHKDCRIISVDGMRTKRVLDAVGDLAFSTAELASAGTANLYSSHVYEIPYGEREIEVLFSYSRVNRGMRSDFRGKATIIANLEPGQTYVVKGQENLIWLANDNTGQPVTPKARIELFQNFRNDN